MSDFKLALLFLQCSHHFSNPVIHQRAISVIRNILYNHDLDVRYTDPEVKSRLATLYLPLVAIVMEALPQLHDPGLENKIKVVG